MMNSMTVKSAFLAFALLLSMHGTAPAQQKDHARWCNVTAVSIGVGQAGGGCTVVSTQGDARAPTQIVLDVPAGDLQQALARARSACARFELAVRDGPEGTAGYAYLRYKLEKSFIKSWSTSGDADDRIVIEREVAGPARTKEERGGAP